MTLAQQPADQLVNPGDTLRLSVRVMGRPRGDLQWYFQGAPLEGATRPTLEIPDAQAANTGNYQVVARSGGLSVTSRVAQVVLQSAAVAPTFTLTPADLWMYVGQGFVFKAAASGSPQPELRWQFEGVELPGTTGGDLPLAGVSEAEGGRYAVIAANAVGSVTNTFRVTVTPKPLLAVTEVMSNASTNVAGHADWWELTNLGTFPVNLKGFRFDDNSESLAAAFTFTNEVEIAAGESVIFTEGLTPEAFRAWWGEDQLNPGLRILTYRGNGLSSAGDAVNVWNAAAAEDSDKVASAVFSTSTMGVSFGFNPDTATFGEPSALGVFGVFTAVSAGDIGSPGYLRNGQQVVRPSFTSVVRVGEALELTWKSEAGRRYALLGRADVGGGDWVVRRTVTAKEASVTVTEPLGGGGGMGQYYRVRLEP